MVSKETVLAVLPPYRDEWKLVTYDQDVPDIISAILKSHKEFAKYYNKICGLFYNGDTASECNTLYDFCHRYIKYCEEPEDRQTTAIPAGVLLRGAGDCKHYAGFIAGTMAAINRHYNTGCKVEYCFASYQVSNRVPYHVFAIITDAAGREYWVDPTPGAMGKIPIWWVRKEVK